MFASFLLLGALLRIALYASFRDSSFDVLTLSFVLGLGLLLDLLVGVVVLAPVLFGLTFLGGLPLRPLSRSVLIFAGGAALSFAALFVLVDHAYGRVHALASLIAPFVLLLSLLTRFLLVRPSTRLAFVVLVTTAMSFSVAVEYYFFEEFNSRFNHIALDYVLYPSEVVTNVWQSYDVPLYLGLALASGLLLTWIFGRGSARASLQRHSWSASLRAGGIALAAIFASFVVLSRVPAVLAGDRITSEIAQNGGAQLVRAYVTSELDYELYYATLPRAEARSRAASVLGFPAPDARALEADPAQFTLARHIESARAAGTQPLDVIVVLEESFGSNFVGTLGAKDGVTPNFDRWSKDGLLLENLVANGNRTVRGLEGVLCSFVPLPGDSITKRTPPASVATLASVLDAFGYATCFLYGGAGTFDGMEPFMTKNGWHEFVQQKDFAADAFTTAWGVADEYIFDALLERHERARAGGRPFFGTLMSGSNHKPYFVPAGRTELADGQPSRKRAVAYSDWALGRWLDSARARGLLERTVVLVVGDHGPRVYGAELIPVESYRIPALYLSPDPNVRGKRFPRLCSQIDLAPTLLALAGVDCWTPFLGQDLSRLQDGPGRAFVQHNRDVGLLTDDLLVVHGLQKTVTFYSRTGRTSDVLALVDESQVTPAMRELARDAAAVFQNAFEMYRAGRYLAVDAARR